MNLNFPGKINLKCRRGSIMVEAALVFPLVILIVAEFISTGINLYEDVRLQSNEHRFSAVERLKDEGLDVKDILRGRWIIR